MFYSLLKNPETLHAAQKQVDEVLGDETLNLSHIPKLTYIDACIKETLRQNSPIGGIALRAKGDTQLDGKYDITATDTIVLSLKTLHRDPEVWGKDADAFRPERMLNGGFESKPPNSWLPFGHGMRYVQPIPYTIASYAINTEPETRYDLEFSHFSSGS